MSVCVTDPPDGHSGVRLFRFLLNELERSEGPDDRGRALAWVDKRRGVFRIVRKKEIAERWGRAKNNNSMTYEKFSRSLRSGELCCPHYGRVKPCLGYLPV